MPEWLLPPPTDAKLPTGLVALVISLVFAFGIGCLVALIHWLTCGRRSDKVDQSFLATLVMLSVLIALITQVIGNSAARAFSLAGTFAIVRFRTVLDDTRDTAFVIFAVAGGMAAGVGYFSGPIIVAPLVLFTAWWFTPRESAPKTSQATLVLRLGVGRRPDDRIDATLKRHLLSYRLIGLSTARGGSAVDASYLIQLPPSEQVFSLVNELGTIEGVQNVEIKGG
jgi:hypothetical protein